jgi:Gpi18-like mannosyltransferase
MIFMASDETAPSPFGKILAAFIQKPAIFIPAILVLGFILRVIFLPNPGFEADISFWKSWGLATYDHGIVWGIENTNNNYPTAFAYVLGAMTWVYSLFADPHNFSEYWSNTNLLFLTISKTPAVVADFIIFGLMVWIGKRAEKLGFPPLPLYLYVLAAMAFFLNPITIMDSAWWGQVDSLGVLIFLVAFIFAVKRYPFLAGLIYMASMMTKLQNMIYGPLFFILLWQLTGFRGLVLGVFGAMTGFVGFNYEFFAARKMGLVFESLTVNYDYFPFLSLNAYNFWWIVAGANGMHILDKFSQIGLVNAKTLGLYLFASLYATAALLMVKNTFRRMVGSANQSRTPSSPISREDTQSVLYGFFSAMIIAACAFFLFQTESHDRYAFPVVSLLPMWFLFYLYTALDKVQRNRVLETRLFKVIVVFFILFTLFYFFNMHNAMVDNYPLNGIPLVRDLNKPFFTLTTSVVHLGLFGVFLFALSRHVSPFWYAVPVLMTAALLVKANLPLITRSPVSVNAFFPIINQQQYGKRQIDMPVNAFNGFNYWSPLSVQYAFYRHGYGTHAKSYQQFHINGNFRKFTTDYGIDTEAGSAGTATFEIYGDNKTLFKSEKIGRYEYPRHIEVDVTGVKLLGLVTNDAGDGINDDHTDWLNPLLWP